MIGPIAEAKGKAKPAAPAPKADPKPATPKIAPEPHPPDTKPRQEVDRAADAHEA
jgi:hypothetical protein